MTLNHLMTDANMPETVAQVIAYHNLTKHHINRYARGPQFLDWAQQPDPFRRFNGTSLLPLQHVALSNKPSYAETFLQGMLAASPLNYSHLSQFFYDSLALSAWKQAGGDKWSLRINPSSGNLHPTEAYLICAACPELSHEAGIFHYAPKEHALEQRAHLPSELWEKLTASFPDHTFFVGLSSIQWREAWKYGERAYRYCQHDVGHAIGAISIAAAGLGWYTTLLDTISTDELTLLLGLTDLIHGDEAEHPDCLLAITPIAIDNTLRPDAQAIAACAHLVWQGTANQVSEIHEKWDIINEVNDIVHKPSSTSPYSPVSYPLGMVELMSQDSRIPLRQIIHQRRSAVAMDGKTQLEAKIFFNLLQQTLPLQNAVPFTSLPWSPYVNLLLFVHRVTDIESGLYCLVRNLDQYDTLRNVMDSRFAWLKPAICPDNLPLYQLISGDTRSLAQQLSCHQNIAARGCFSVGMLARFEPCLKQFGAWFYPRLFWEAGVIGQVLYLASEHAGLAGTGIGCFFDDAVHEMCGFNNRQYQSLYHFTIGGRVEDKRLLTLPAYENI